MSNLYLARQNLAGFILEDIDFSTSSLSATSFRGARIRRCRFSKARLYGAVFREAQIGEGTTFEGANITGADFRGTKDLDFSAVLVAESWYLAIWDPDDRRTLAGMAQRNGIPIPDDAQQELGSYFESWNEWAELKTLPEALEYIESIERHLPNQQGGPNSKRDPRPLQTRETQADSPASI